MPRVHLDLCDYLDEKPAEVYYIGADPDRLTEVRLCDEHSRPVRDAATRGTLHQPKRITYPGNAQATRRTAPRETNGLSVDRIRRLTRPE